jgi:hypothetical protein
MGAESTFLMTQIEKATSDSQSFTAGELEDLESRCRALKAEATAWRRHYDAYIAGSEPPEEEANTTGNSWTELLSAGCSLQALSCRLVGAMSRRDIVAEEHEALAHSAAMKKLLQSTALRNGGVATFYVAQKGAVADAIFSTTKLWLTGRDGCPGREPGANATSAHDRLINVEIYRAWRNHGRQGKGRGPVLMTDES